MKLNEIEIYQKLASKEISYDEAKEFLRLLHKGSETVSKNENKLEEIKQQIIDIMRQLLHIEKSELNINENLKELGVDSINAAEIVYEMNRVFGTNLDTTVIYDYVTIAALSDYIYSLQSNRFKQNGERVYEKDVTCKEESPIKKDTMEIIKNEIVEIVGKVLHIEPEKIDINMSFNDLGIDSINGVEIVKAINDSFKTNLDTVTLYDYSTIIDLSKHLIMEIDRNSKILNSKDMVQSKTKAVKGIEGNLRKRKTPPFQLKTVRKQTIPHIAANSATNRIVLKQKQSSEEQAISLEDTLRKTQIKKSQMEDIGDIAVIGIAGKYPEANNTEELWKNLKNGENCISKISENRWKEEKNSEPYYGGFMSGIDKFDPLFFHITPMEAELMDPQQRIFMQQAYAALEDAGYSERALSKLKCGIYVGATQGDYANLLKKSNQYNSAYAFTGLNTFILTGRLSYYLDLIGPNMSIDTACSSSLVAIKQACDSLRLNECDMTVAGGIRLMVTSDLHKQLEELGMLAEDGKCYALDEKASGMVLGEGVGVIVLKRKSDALRDGDHIYGVIKNYAVNQDGKTNGMLSPSVQSQFELENEVYDKSKINPESIGYIEASCTGTKMGDAIELKALNRVFKQYTNKEGYCAIGSIKANIGHTTMASGVISIIKVLLMLKHKQLIPQINFNELNTQIDLSSSPFYINTKIREWETNGNQPRRAAVSSFGISGTNCHMVFEENLTPSRKSTRMLPFYLVVLSAKTKTALERKKEDLKAWLRNDGKDEKLCDVAFTLLNGRSFFEERETYVVSNINELLNKLEKNNKTINDNDVKTTELGNQLIEELSNYNKQNDDYKRKLEKLAEYFVLGYEVNWDKLYEDCGYCKLSLPTYPFDKSVYWVSCEAEEKNEVRVSVNNYLHPMIHRNTSTIYEQRFYSMFTRETSFLRDHMINGKMVLPAVSYLEMARAAGSFSLEKEVTTIKDLIWSSPFILDKEKKEIEVSISPSDDIDDILEFEISSVNNDESSTDIYCQGRIVTESEKTLEESGRYSMNDLLKKCTKSITGNQFYSDFLGEALYLGETMHSIQRIDYNSHEALLELEINENKHIQNEYILHPSLINGIVECTIVLIKENEFMENAVYMPFALEKLTILNTIPNRCYAYLRYENDKKGDYLFNIDILNSNGDIIAIFSQLWIRVMPMQKYKRITNKSQNNQEEIKLMLKRLVLGEIDVDRVANYIGGLLDET